ncbi:hypothetical protein LLT6_01425 [Lactococcus cremoris subsp. cremoris TIFN6]|uniref:DUF5648 domain-containing protein n=1 Tax=Lactococcus cremoris subsp. cremoris TIFN6 TaxID=1234876 RepID=T0S7K1_LACLC|nr:hypothetical protein LLT6_01425 [Lactococcus cremoris subsp. cremoris TIFN6]
MNIYTSHQKLFKNGFLFGALLLGLAFSFKEATPAKAVTANFNGPVYRLYNPNSGEHVYTMGLTEKIILSIWVGVMRECWLTPTTTILG